MASFTHTSSRRALLGGLAAAPIALSALPALALAGDADIARAWAEWIAAQRLMYSEAADDEAVHLAASRRIDAAEDIIMKAAATTSRGARAKLLISLPHIQADRWIEESSIRGNLQALFDREAELDFPARLVVQAVHSLQKTEH